MKCRQMEQVKREAEVIAWQNVEPSASNLLSQARGTKQEALAMANYAVVDVMPDKVLESQRNRVTTDTIKEMFRQQFQHATNVNKVHSIREKLFSDSKPKKIATNCSSRNALKIQNIEE